ncbi:MAG: FG-GAP-like repeat-containing protein, partial [Rhodospirillales bacterium]|nr:FG-GAP-like repeat-containing protein [Rhodospirillales bacterium]
MLCTQKTSRLALALLATTMLTQPGPARAAPGDALGPEFQVNTFTLGDQVLPAVAMDADGHFVVAWEGYGSSELKGIFAKRFDATGVAQGSEFLVNSFTTNNQNWSAIAMDADGDFVVAWESRDQDGSLYGIFAQRFDAAGVAQGSEVQVNTFSTSAQRLPAVAMDTDGDFVVAWTSYEQDGSDWGVFAQRYDAAGVAQGPEFQVNTFTTGTQWFPAVAMDADGDFVVAWEGYGSGEANGIFAQRYDAAGAAQGPEFQVNTFTAFDQAFPAVAMDADGDFVVAWQSPQDGSFRGVFAQRYDAAGVAQGPEFQVNTFTTGDQADPAVAMDADGDFVVAWASRDQDGSLYGIFAQRYDAVGVAQGSEFQANTFTTDHQAVPAVAMDADGDFVVAWASAFQDDSLDGVFAQRYDGVERVEGDFDGDGNADLLWRNVSTGNTVIWLMEGTAKLAAQPIGVVPPVWQVVATGDFNGDGKADILWRHTGNGSTLVWQMD